MSDFAGMTVIFCRNDTSDSVDNFVEIEDFLASRTQNYPHVILRVKKVCKSNCINNSNRNDGWSPYVNEKSGKILVPMRLKNILKIFRKKPS